jgi:probable rRNA maturation factor
MPHMPDPAASLEFQITVASWQRLPRLRARLQHAVQVAWEYLPTKYKVPVQATLLLTGNARIKQLNRDFRGLDKATNVLSFPQFLPRDLPKIGKQKTPVALGDIAIAYAYSIKESRENNKIEINHIIHLVIHGFLHLFGYDHGSVRDAAVMEKLEIKIMHALGLPNPYLSSPVEKKRKR